MKYDCEAIVVQVLSIEKMTRKGWESYEKAQENVESVEKNYGKVQLSVEKMLRPCRIIVDTL